MKNIDKLALISVKSNKVLMVLSKGRDLYYFPGGKREENETDEEALCREIKEELLVDLDKSTIEYYDTFTYQADNKPEGVNVQMTCYIANTIGELIPNAEIEKYAWIGYTEKEKLSLSGKRIFEDLYNKNIIH